MGLVSAGPNLNVKESTIMLPICLIQAIETEEQLSKMEQLYDEYERLLYCVAYEYFHDKHRAEDAVHDTFLKIIDRLDNIFEIKCPQTKNYLVTITKHICINLLKSKNYSSELTGIDNDIVLAETIPNNYEDAEDLYFEKADVSAIKDALGELPERLQTTMILYAVDGYSMKEIAELDGCSVEAVKKRIQRARARIVELIKSE